ncbi:hypothetical protein [Massilia yuzhufengensis]|uniref:Uncharacterized protein n=1 Tax=Massilia yuzhufengensis TaxID=1164594 RepID=A0A1I1JWV4_9BURK|nr:hypothetical protein [Massilia yuzhufengensis]SFC53117.1 hypothetical protein SAMN05216204_10763 [Massilia yuzhufengensis]
MRKVNELPSSYGLIFRVSFGHAFFADGTLRALRIVPVPACHDMLRRAGLLLRAQEDGIAAYGDAKAVQRLRLHIAEAGASLRMGFQVFLTDPLFFEYTAPAWPKGKLLFLDTSRAFPDAAGRQRLHATSSVPVSAFLDRDHADLAPIFGKHVLAPAPAMALQVVVSSALLEASEPGQRHFHAHFDAAGVALAGDGDFQHFGAANIADDRRAHVFPSKRAIAKREVGPLRFHLRAAARRKADSRSP